MPNSYIFKVKTKLTPEQVVTIAAKANDTTPKIIGDSFTFSVDVVFVVGVRHSDNPITKQVSLEEYGFMPTVQVTFEYGYSVEPETVEPILKRSVFAMLKEIDGDAVFLHNYENVKLRRFNNFYEVEDSFYYEWLTSGLKEAGLKYKIVSTQPMLT